LQERRRQVRVAGQGGWRGHRGGRRPERRGFGSPAVPPSAGQIQPPTGAQHRHRAPKLKRPGVTLWEEYAAANPLAYKYTSFCVKYREFVKAQQRVLRQLHIAGETLFIDYAGDTVPVVDAATGEITRAQIFEAVLGAWNYTFACATPRQTTEDWIGAQVLALKFIGGVPKLVVPHQARALQAAGCAGAACDVRGALTHSRSQPRMSSASSSSLMKAS